MFRAEELQRNLTFRECAALGAQSLCPSILGIGPSDTTYVTASGSN